MRVLAAPLRALLDYFDFVFGKAGIKWRSVPYLFLYSHFSYATAFGWDDNTGTLFPDAAAACTSLYNRYRLTTPTGAGYGGPNTTSEALTIGVFENNPLIYSARCNALHGGFYSNGVDDYYLLSIFTKGNCAGQVDLQQGACNTKGQGKPSCGSSHPIDFGLGNKYLPETDYVGLGPYPLQLTRNYNSQRHSTGVFGFGWSNDMTGWISTSGTTTLVSRPDGKVLFFKLINGAWVADADNTDKLVQLANASGWKYTMPDGTVEIYNSGGKRTSITNPAGYTQTTTYSDATTGPNGGYLLYADGTSTGNVLPKNYPIRVTDSTGRSLTIQYGYDASFVNIFPIRITDPAVGLYKYEYDSNFNLTRVTYPDGKTKKYLYGEVANVSATPDAGVSNVHALTGIIDENGVRYASYWYDAQGKAYKEEIAPTLNLGIDKHTMAYTTDTSGNPISTTVIDPRNTARTYNFSTIVGIPRSTGQSQPGGSGCGAATNAVTYDPNGNVATRTDFNGNTTIYSYDLSRNLETSRTEAVGRPEMRTISTTWHPTYRLPLTITEPGRLTTNVYDDTSGNLLSRSIADTVTGKTRVWTYTYTTAADGTLANLLKSVDGPRTDVSDITTYTYYPNGDLQTITNALGHVTRITQYDPNGRPLTINDPNSIVTNLTYWPRGWLKSRSVAGETTYYDYDGVGQIKKVTSPDGSFISYTYDDAHRLSDIYDAQGDTIHYTLDPIGNRIKEDVYNNLGQLVTTKSRVFDALNRLWKDIGALNQTTTYAYDANGNLTRIDGPLATQNEVTINSYDALNRLASSTDGLNGITRYSYDALDQLRSVTDPRSLTTSYTVNALGEQTQLVSPDTGTTNSAYDAAGNLSSRTDADGKVVSYSYDALNRVTAIKYDGQPQYSFSYDQGQNALGKLSGMSNGSNQANPTTWSYNSQGRVQSKVQQTGSVSLTTSYSYYPTGQLASITYPSGKIVAYGYNLLGQLSSIGVNGQPVIIGASYQPFGPVASWTWGNNSPYARSFDSDGRLFSYPLGPLNTRALGFDNASRIQNQTETSPFANTLFTYDELDRLKTWQPPNTNQSYYYDANGNRISLVLGANSYSNSISPSSNRLQSVAGPSAKTYSYNNSGNRISDGTNSFNYDSGERLIGVNFPGGSSFYSINALGQRILKTGSGGNINFVYDEGGKLIGEYDSNGLPIEETLYLGDLPVAVLR